MKIVNWHTASPSVKNNLLARAGMAQKKEVKIEVSDIITQVRELGDVALHHYTKLFDGVALDSLRVDLNDPTLTEELDVSLRCAIDKAYDRIKCFHALQMPKKVSLSYRGMAIWRQYKPIEAVGLYIPAGTAPLISTFLMLAIPATLAGCKKIVVVTPPDKNGIISLAIRYVAKICNIEHLYTIGGAQAIAALAYGTKTIPKVMKIFGPGNKYVTEAKLQVSQDPDGAAFDMPAGPSEVLVIADESANPDLVAADLLAQAEHDKDAKAVCITTQSDLACRINQAIENQITSLSRQVIIRHVLQQNAIIVVDTLQKAFDLSNLFAPEHLILQINQPNDYLDLIDNAGSVFIGPWSAEALGDYATGPNHVLPTYGYAKTYSGLGIKDFMKAISFQAVSFDALQDLASTVETLATLEGLDAHQASVSIRRQIQKVTS